MSVPGTVRIGATVLMLACLLTSCGSGRGQVLAVTRATVTFLQFHIADTAGGEGGQAVVGSRNCTNPIALRQLGQLLNWRRARACACLKNAKILLHLRDSTSIELEALISADYTYVVYCYKDECGLKRPPRQLAKMLLELKREVCGWED